MNLKRTLVLTLICALLVFASSTAYAQSQGGLVSIDVSVNSSHPYDVEEAIAREDAFNNLQRMYPNRCFSSPADPALEPRIVDSYLTYVLDNETGKPKPLIIHVWRVFYFWEPC